MRKLTIGTRGSALALRQVEIVSDALRVALPEIEIKVSVTYTEGDRRQDISLEEAGGEGIFVKDIERRLLAGEIDLAVHSLKDVPSELPRGLEIAAVLARADARDILVSRYGNLSQLPAQARIGTDSRRRAVQLQALRPDIETTSVRGNVETRIRKSDGGEIDGVMLALAGLTRLGIEGRATQIFSIEEVLPAVGQAVLAIETRSDDVKLNELLRKINHEPTEMAIRGERAFLNRLGAGCRLPVGAYGEVKNGVLQLRGMVADESGRLHKHILAGPADIAEALGITLAETLLAAAGA